MWSRFPHLRIDPARCCRTTSLAIASARSSGYCMARRLASWWARSKACCSLAPRSSRFVSSRDDFRMAKRSCVESLSQWLVKNRFHSTSAVEMPGEFSVRGGILDLFAWDWIDPVRIELFDDQIESIRRFDVATQRSLESMEHLEITVLGSHREVGGCLTDYLGSGSLCLLVEPSQMQAEATHLMERAEDPEELLTFNSVQKKADAIWDRVCRRTGDWFRDGDGAPQGGIGRTVQRRHCPRPSGIGSHCHRARSLFDCRDAGGNQASERNPTAD